MIYLKTQKIYLLAVILFFSEAGFAQEGKDTVVYNLPVTAGKLIYHDSLIVKGKTAALLDSAALKWIKTFPYRHRLSQLKGIDSTNVWYGRAATEFTCKPE